MSWKAEYLILLMFSTLVDYMAALMMDKVSDRKRKIFLLLSIFSNIGLLFAFKYFNFCSDSLRSLFAVFSWHWPFSYFNVLLPVGISFYTFQALSYTIDVYRKRIPAEKHLGIFALYISFFPQLVAGPIERAKNLLPQFFEKHYFSYLRVIDGLKIILWGFFKKLVIADRLAIVVNAVYNDPTNFSGPPLVLATCLFAFQIYCDFSGYSDIAIGSAKIMGFSLMENFRRPYYAQSISDFWKRWHISLTTWFKDYLYIPLGGNRVRVPRWYFNLFIVFLISGIWHGANWTFVIWGALHGFYFLFSIWTEKIRIKLVSLSHIDKLPRLHSLFRILVNFILVTFSWIFFRANSLSDAWYIVKDIYFNFGDMAAKIFNLGSGQNILQMDKMGIDKSTLIIAGLSLILLLSFEYIQETFGIRKLLSKTPVWLRILIYPLIILGILLFGVFEEKAFIYFQF